MPPLEIIKKKEEEEEEEAEEVDVEEEEEEEVEEEEDEEEEEEEEEEEAEEEEVDEKAEDDKKESTAQPSVAESIGQLQTLHDALSKFLHHYNSLQQTLDHIQSTINTRSKTLDSIQSTTTNSAATKEEVKKNKKTKQPEEKPTPPSKNEEKGSELEIICKTMAARDLRRYMAANLDEADRLHREVPEALKRAQDVGRLVLNAIGRFYTQTNNAYRPPFTQSTQNRRASILLLELYLLNFSPAPDANQSCKEDAAEASNIWRKRIIQESGINFVGDVDALGLVLLLASFGIPPEFSNWELATLLRRSNLKKNAAVFRRSSILLEKMPDIIRDLITKDKPVEAVDLICAFDLGTEFPLKPLLSSFVRKTSEEVKEGQCSTRSLKEANEKKLVALKSVVKCLEEHNLDASEFDSIDINQKIAKLEKEISMMGQKWQDKNSKRKLEDVKPYKSLEPRAKRLWSASSAEASHGLIDGRAGGWHVNGVAYHQNSAGQSLPGMPYAPGDNFMGQLAAADQSLYYPPAYPHGMGGMDYNRNFYHPAAPNTGHHFSNAVPAAPNTGYHLSNAVPAAPNTGHHFSNAVPAAPNTGYHYGNAVPTDPNTGYHYGNAVPTDPNTGHHLPVEFAGASSLTGHQFGYAVPAAPNTAHHLGNAVPAAPNTGDQINYVVPAVSNANPTAPNAGHHLLG